MGITNVLFAGVGGQGILTSGRILAIAALHAGLDVKMSEVHGMSQRGGNVDVHVRVGPDVPSSLIPRGGAHFLVAFEKLEALRYLDYLRPDGVAFANRLEIPPVATSLKEGASYVPDIDAVLAAKAPKLVWVDGAAIAAELGDSRLVNTVLIGALSSHLPFLKAGDWEAAIRERFKAKLQDINLKAFARGAEVGKT
mgnify:CR=1 FL=1